MNLKKILKKVLLPIANAFFDFYTTPHNCPQTNLLRKIVRTYKYKLAGKGYYFSKDTKKISSYKDIHKGGRCFIIGNGPSLNKLDLSLLKNEITFGVNAIYTNYEKMNFYPTYYVVEDVFVAEDRADEINSYKGSIKFFGNYLRYVLKDDEKTNWLNVIFRYDDYKNFPTFSTNAARYIWTGGTVSYLSLQLAYYMGFSDVYLVGFDHNYVIPDSVVMKGTDILSTDDDLNHFSKDYFGKGKRWHDPMVDRMELSYKKALQNFSREGRKIWNATAGGKLEVFNRVNYNSLFKND